jgi:hypothetical protein
MCVAPSMTNSSFGSRCLGVKFLTMPMRDRLKRRNLIGFRGFAVPPLPGRSANVHRAHGADGLDAALGRSGLDRGPAAGADAQGECDLNPRRPGTMMMLKVIKKYSKASGRILIKSDQP